MQNANDAVFEYLIDQLRQQVNSNRCGAPAHEVQSLKSELARYKKPYIAYVKKTDWMLEDSRFFKKWGKHRADILRECIQEQDAEIQSLKNQLRDASALVAELQEDNIKKSEHILHLTGRVKDLAKQLAEATGDVEAYKLARKGEHGPEQSSCRGEDTQECEHEWRVVQYSAGLETNKCRLCGAEKEVRYK